MPRIRTIKPDFFTSLTIADLSHQVRLTFIGLWTHVDDEGRCVDDARLVKAAIWPLDDRSATNVDTDLGELADAGLILRYTVGGKHFLAVRSWQEHQTISRPSGSKHPSPQEGETTPKPHEALTEDSVRAHGARVEDSYVACENPSEGSHSPHNAPEMPDSANEGAAGDHDDTNAAVVQLFTSENTQQDPTHGGLSEDSVNTPRGKGTGNREQGTGNSLPRSARASDSEPTLDDDFDTFYVAYPRKKEPRKARKAYEAAIKRGAPPERILAAAHRYAHERRGQPERYTKYPAAWLNADCFEDQPDQPPPAAAVAGGHQPYRNRGYDTADPSELDPWPQAGDVT